MSWGGGLVVLPGGFVGLLMDDGETIVIDDDIEEDGRRLLLWL